MPYIADDHRKQFSPDELRARIPGWGADADPSDRPSVPREKLDLPTGAHWTFPDRQEPSAGRERSIEHGMLPPVFGTSAPLHGVSGAIRRYAYDHYSEGRAAHWLLLMLGDRVDAVGSHVRSLASAHPDNPITETGIFGERRHRPISSRFGQRRADVKHAWMDPIIVAGPWVLAGIAVVSVVKRVARRR
ncbi:hypothetical protein ACFVWR_00135 [Leifsonia sp. NPDC058292]|uniref:hypothetical protein n=1 Tax=Leifsonia sp. NPDC058292 TaxID=3346428 RepID=UPI0036DC13BD